MKRLTRLASLIVLTSTFIGAQTEPSSRSSARLGDLLIALSEIDPANEPGHFEANRRHELLIKGAVRNIGKKPVCSTLDARRETSSKLDEFAATTLAGQNSPSISELSPGAELGARFLASVDNGTSR